MSFWDRLEIFMLDWVMPPLTILLMVAVFAVPAILLLSWWNGRGEDDCMAKRKILVRHAAYTTLIPVGKVLIPIRHPEKDLMDWVCTERQ